MEKIADVASNRRHNAYPCVFKIVILAPDKDKQKNQAYELENDRANRYILEFLKPCIKPVHAKSRKKN